MPAILNGKRVTNLRLFEKARSSTPPRGGYRAETFGPRERAAYNRDMRMARRLIMLRITRELLPIMARVFTPIPGLVADRFLELMARSGKATRLEIDFGYEQELWNEAITQVMGEFGHELVIEMEPRIQSVVDESYSRASVLIGAEQPPLAASRTRLVRSRALASRITGINDSTRRILNRTINTGYEQGLTGREVAQRILDRAPSITRNRIPTIIRTEMGTAADTGTIVALEASNVVTHMDVIGCQAIEPNIPTYKGVPTCNITNVPVQDAGSLRWHINHTGAIVASQFIGYDGTVTPHAVGSNPP